MIYSFSVDVITNTCLHRLGSAIARNYPYP